MESVFKMAKGYYPARWDRGRIDALYEAGRLTAEEYQEITGEAPKAQTEPEDGL